MEHLIRPVRADEWREVRDLRLDALRDPAAPVAFLDTYENALTRSDAYWQERTAAAAEGSQGAHQFVAEAPDGSWAGTLTALVERPDGEVRFGAAPGVDQTHVVGVYVRPEERGGGLADALFRAALEWSWSLAEPVVQRVRLYVHEGNPRAAAFYRKAGFVPTGESEPVPGGAGARELEYEVRRPVTG
ncbi:GNAT family N-acetyltransferase [Streptomyces sp. SP18CS02]|uniref:GNAT family N-acetyltransferase n=1 Tax=Streptomyces sp. SP18CS02 TaxID=3002531 RepID=UPI002E77408E|nr:GNAT family N-acetyltransferase [Streptomyces sp. SP18CS02]MEE1755534.1 GNAT family N-acetyltransferase [Streptomyces sp. SP18CS02]